MKHLDDDPRTSEIEADAEAVFESLKSGKPLDSEVRRRVVERSDRATMELRKRSGLLNVAVNLVRDVRDEE